MTRPVTFVRSVDVVRLLIVVVVFKKRVVFVKVAVMFKLVNPLKLRRTMFFVVVGTGGCVGKSLGLLSRSVFVSVSVLLVLVVDVGKVGRVISEKEVGLEMCVVVEAVGAEDEGPTVVMMVVSISGVELGATEFEGINGVECTLELGATELEGIKDVECTLELGATELEGINRVDWTLELGGTELEMTPDEEGPADEELPPGADPVI